MSFFRRIFGGAKKSFSNKPTRPDSPTNKIIKKFLFYGFFFFTTATILSKKYKTNLIFSFQPTDQNLKIIDTNPVFHQGVYNPVYWMLVGPLQRYYAKKIEEAPYFRAVSEPATQKIQQIFQLPVHDKHSKKENLSVVVLLTGSEGLDNVTKKLMISMNTNGFKTICIKTDDFHNIQRLKNTIEHIRNKNPNSKIFGVGLEYGANLLVNLASQNQKLLSGIVSIGNPLDLQKSQRNIQNSNFLWKKLLYNDIVKGRIQSCRKNRELFGDKPVLPSDTQLYEIDRACYSGQYQDYQELKQKLSSVNSIKNLTVPSLFIQSQQDPFSMQIYVIKSSLEQNQQKLQNPNCIFVQTQRGGHLEWFESLKKIRWIARPIATYLRYLDGRLAGFTQGAEKAV